jgi:hypothetical protein
MVDFIILAADVYLVYINILKNMYNCMMDKSSTLDHADYYFYGLLGLLAIHLICLLVVLCYYLNRTMDLQMIKEGGLSDEERGLVLGLAPGGRSRTSTEVAMGMRAGATQEIGRDTYMSS